MRRAHVPSALMLTLGLGSSSAVEEPSTAASEAEDEATIAGPAAIGFFPPVSQKERDDDDGGLREGYAHLGFALEDLATCLAPRNLSLRIKITRSLRVRNGEFSRDYRFPLDWAHSVGIVLVAPGKAPEVVFATAGPGSLSELAPQAAWTYFSEPNCKRW